ncbi:hypothetical protein K0M31_000249 [Melipona bicolor]|uniref:Uncharacterized protein n=1 Tax=Melipona bicolor TaxID=60889 RepID=A0AA40KWV6_9HYME|nr:hypothetical protein K0M31_000249 [Melipona bicolor]
MCMLFLHAYFICGILGNIESNSQYGFENESGRIVPLLWKTEAAKYINTDVEAVVLQKRKKEKEVEIVGGSSD